METAAATAMAAAFLNASIYVVIAVAIAWIATYLITNYLPIDAAIKNILNTVIWAVVVIFCLLRLFAVVA